MVRFIIKDKETYKPDVTIEQYDQSLIENIAASMLNNRLRELVNSTNPPFTYGSVYHGGTYARSKEAFQGFAMTKEGGQVSALKVLLEEVERAKDLVLPNPNWIVPKLRLYPTSKDPIITVTKQRAECWLMNMFEISWNRNLYRELFGNMNIPRKACLL
jgi:hypothetical protein